MKNFKLMFCKESNTIGLITFSDGDDYVKMVNPHNVKETFSYIRKTIKMENIEFVICGGYLVTDGMVLFDVDSGSKIVLSFNKITKNFDFYASDKYVEVNTKTFKKHLTGGAGYDKIYSVTKDELSKYDSESFLDMISGLSKKGGTIELLGNIRTIKY